MFDISRCNMILMANTFVFERPKNWTFRTIAINFRVKFLATVPVACITVKFISGGFGHLLINSQKAVDLSFVKSGRA